MNHFYLQLPLGLQIMDCLLDLQKEIMYAIESTRDQLLWFKKASNVIVIITT
jgi:hypothetical protein